MVVHTTMLEVSQKKNVLSCRLKAARQAGRYSIVTGGRLTNP